MVETSIGALCSAFAGVTSFHGCVVVVCIAHPRNHVVAHPWKYVDKIEVAKFINITDCDNMTGLADGDFGFIEENFILPGSKIGYRYQWQ